VLFLFFHACKVTKEKGKNEMHLTIYFLTSRFSEEETRER
jgi:hypothetical protein